MTRHKILTTTDGRSASISAWSKETGIARHTIHARISLGWTPDEALGFSPRGKGELLTSSDDQSKTVYQWSKKTGVPAGTIHYRLSRGLTIEQAVGIDLSPLNSRRWKKFEWNGKVVTITELSRQSGITASCLRQRLSRGENVSMALSRPSKKHGQKHSRTDRKIVILSTLSGESATVSEWSAKTGISVTKIYNRVYRQGWSVEEALEIVPRKGDVAEFS